MYKRQVFSQAPLFTTDPINEVNATEGVAYSASLANDAFDPESDPMTFSKVSGPTWLNVAADGTLSGTPSAGDVGANVFTVQVNATGGSDTATLNITVDAGEVNQAPSFTSDPITKVSATEGVAYSSSLTNDASDPESDPLTFSKVSGPAWLNVAADGTLSGTPSAGDVGANAFTVQVSASGGNDTATLNITVLSEGNGSILINEPFVDLNGGTGLGAWALGGGNFTLGIADDTMDPSFAGVIEAGVYLRRGGVNNSAEVSSVIDASVDLVTPGAIYFSVLIRANATSNSTNAAFILGTDALNGGSAPGSMMNTTNGGNGIGLGLNDTGLYAYVYQDGVGTESTGSITVADANTVTETFLIVGEIIWGNTDTLNLYNIANVNDPLPTAFATVSGNLDETLFNMLAIGDRRRASFDEIRFAYTVESLFNLDPSNQPPSFTSDPINEVSATEGLAYSSSLADDASDAESDPMTFSKLSGPAWLSVAADGTLSGTPSAGDVGANVFTVQVSATGGSDTATLNITVDVANQPPSFTSDPINEVSAKEGLAYSSSLADDASDAESDPMTFSKLSGPAWLSLSLIHI